MALARVGGCLSKSFASNFSRAVPSSCHRSAVGVKCLLQSSAAALPVSRCLLTQVQAKGIGAFAAHPVHVIIHVDSLATGAQLTQRRGVVKWSHRTGKRKTVKAVVKRFMYLDWPGRGIWVRPRTGKYKRRWRQSSRRKARLNQHVFTNATQSRMLDKMATKFWRKQFHFIDDMYAGFHVRDNFPLTSRPPPAP